jgi:Domain of unknown function (DUF5615)
MIRFLADENFDNEILRGVRRRVPEVEFLRAQDTELAGKPDTVLLEWAAHHNYIVLTHDVNTMRGYYYDRVNADLPVPGVFLIHGTKPIGQVIDTLELILLASDKSEWQGKIEYLP